MSTKRTALAVFVVAAVGVGISLTLAPVTEVPGWLLSRYSIFRSASSAPLSGMKQALGGNIGAEYAPDMTQVRRLGFGAVAPSAKGLCLFVPPSFGSCAPRRIAEKLGAVIFAGDVGDVHVWGLSPDHVSVSINGRRVTAGGSFSATGAKVLALAGHTFNLRPPS